MRTTTSSRQLPTTVILESLWQSPNPCRMDGWDNRNFSSTPHFGIVVEEPRLLLVRVKAPSLRLRSLCRLGSIQSAHVGAAGATEESVNGAWLHCFMESRSLWAPSTFEDIHSGSHGTWQRPHTLEWSRLDYVLFPLAWGCKTSYVDDKFDPALGTLDHSAVSAEMVFAGKPVLEQNVIHRPAPRQRLSSAALSATQPLSLSGGRPPRPEVDVHTHSAWLCRRLVELGEHCSWRSSSSHELAFLPVLGISSCKRGLIEMPCCRARGSAVCGAYV